MIHAARCSGRERRRADARGDGEVLDDFGRSDEERVEAVLDRAVADGDGDVGLAAAGLAVKDERAAVGDEVGRQRRAEQRQLTVLW